MPPPPSPKLPQQQLNDATTINDVPSTIEVRHKTHVRSYSRPSSSASFRSTATDDVGLVEQLQSRLDALEYENERLRTASEAPPAVDSSQLEQLQSEKQSAIDRATELEANLAGFEQNLKSRDDEVRKLVTQNLKLTTQLNDATSEVQRSLASHEQETQAHHATLTLVTRPGAGVGTS
jgi:CAP-Gly domain-containing linker protein 1